jgi:hypothetical protein
MSRFLENEWEAIKFDAKFLFPVEEGLVPKESLLLI